MKKTSSYLIPMPSFEKQAGIKVGPDPDLWSEKVFQYFAEHFPELGEMSNGTVVWDEDKIDEEGGFGVGQIILRSNEQTASIPIIVREFSLEPIDIFLAGDKMALINDDNIGRALGITDSVGVGAIPERGSRFTTSQFNTWVPKLAGEGSIVGTIENLIKIAKKFEPYSDGTIEKLSSWKDVKPEKVAAPNGTTYLFEKVGIGDVKRTSYLNGSVINVEQDKFDGDKFAGYGDAIRSAFDVGSSIALGITKLSNVGILDLPPDKDIVTIDGPGSYDVFVKSDVHGMQKSPAFQFNVLQIGQEKVAEGAKTLTVANFGGSPLFSYQDGILGSPNEGTEIYKDLKSIDEIVKGDQGVFLYDNGDDHPVVCTQVLQIKSVEATPIDHKKRIYAEQAGNPLQLIVEEDLGMPVPLPDEDKYQVTGRTSFLIPKMVFLPLTGPTEMVVLFDDLIHSRNTKLAHIHDGSVLQLNYVYRAKMDPLVIGKIAGREFEDSPRSLVARLASMGVEQEKIAEIIKILNTEPTIKIAGIVDQLGAAIKHKPLSLVDDTKVAKVLASLKNVIPDLVKSAIVINYSIEKTADHNVGDDQTTPDAVLGLGLMDKENITHYVSMIPEFEDTAHNLAKMLYSIRIGLVGIDQGAVKSALTNVTKVTSSLRELASGADQA